MELEADQGSQALDLLAEIGCAAGQVDVAGRSAIYLIIAVSSPGAASGVFPYGNPPGCRPSFPENR